MALKPRERRQAILQHVARYTLTFRPVLDRLFFNGKSCRNVVEAMVDEGFLVARRGLDADRPCLPGGHAYYQLTREQCGVQQVPVSRAEPVSPGAFEEHVAVLWNCCFSEHKATPLKGRHLAKLLEQPPKGKFCLEIAPPHRLQRLVLVTPGTRDSTYIKRFKADYEAAQAHAQLQHWMHARRFRYVFLVPNEPRGQDLYNQIKGMGYLHNVDVRYVVVPTIETLHKALAGVSEA